MADDKVTYVEVGQTGVKFDQVSKPSLIVDNTNFGSIRTLSARTGFKVVCRYHLDLAHGSYKFYHLRKASTPSVRIAEMPVEDADAYFYHVKKDAKSGHLRFIIVKHNEAGPISMETDDPIIKSLF